MIDVPEPEAVGKWPDDRKICDTERHVTSSSECDIEAKVVRMLAAGRAIRAHLREPITSDHSCLYDENGLPL
jgi:hypothetical protein